MLVELMARFDEQSNIRWARSLEEAGAHVIYGIRGYKTHAKICLVVRRGKAGIKRYVHLGTGNYNDRTARLYTDFGLMTGRPRDRQGRLGLLQRADRLLRSAAHEEAGDGPDAAARARPRADRARTAPRGGGPGGGDRAKMNSLVDEDIIQALYEASRAGVRIRLNVRGICCLRPGLKGVSETSRWSRSWTASWSTPASSTSAMAATKRSTLASADWMPRNLDRRVELLFPVEIARVPCEGARRPSKRCSRTTSRRAGLQPDGTYKRRKPAKGEEPFRVQAHLHGEAQRALERARAKVGVTLEPIASPKATT